jgi:ribosomal protein S18 acetylase RimI-like enzyme
MDRQDIVNGDIEIRPLGDSEEAGWCARLMAGSEPWITLKRDYDLCVKILTSPTREVYVARLHGALVGFTILIMQGAFVGFIQTVAIAPEWRNRGIGSQLVRFAEERIFKVSPNVFLCVSSFNQSAQRLYERLGYKVVGGLKDLMVRGHSEILMRKTTGPTSEFTPEA